MIELVRAIGPVAGVVGAGVAAAGASALAYGTYVERIWYRLSRVRVPGVLRQPTERPLVVLHISDLHLDPPERRKRSFLEELAGHDYDLVVATGDLVGAADAEEETARALSVLTAGGRPGVAVLGSHDLFAPTPKNPMTYFTRPQLRVHGPPLATDRLIERLAEAGWQTLRAERSEVATALGTLAVAGLEDAHLSTTVLPEAGEIRPDDAGGCGHLLHLGLTHAPYQEALDLLVETDHDLLMAGHTHGGQVRVPLVGALTTNCDLPLSQARGLSHWDGAWLHVSAGLGTSRFAPFRFACRPEATLVELS